MKISFFRPFFVLVMGILYLFSLFIENYYLNVIIAFFTVMILISYLPYLKKISKTIVILLIAFAFIFYTIAGDFSDLIEGLLMNTSVLMIFIFVPLLSIPITSDRYIKDISGLLISSFTNTKKTYNVLKLASFSMGSVLNVGALPILYYLTELDQFKHHKTMRMTALNRGFSLAFLWSPYFISVAVILSYFEVQWLNIAAYGIVISAVSLLGEWFYIKPTKYPQISKNSPIYYSKKRILELILILSTMTILIIIIDIFSEISVIDIIPLVSILVFFFWTFSIGGMNKTLAGFKSYTQERIPNMGNELLIFISAGIFGISLLLIGFDSLLIEMLESAGVNHVLLLIPVFGLILIVLSFLSVHPIITVTVICLAVLNMNIEISDHYYIAIGLLLNWAIIVNLAPFTGINLLLSSITEKSILTMPKQNWLYSLGVWLIGYLVIVVLYFI